MTAIVVQVTEGSLKGAVVESPLGFKYHSFKGIPYAAPPVGELRFKPPQPLQPWEGEREAIKHGPVCPQYDMFTKTVTPGQEDCLYLNIYTKDIRKNKLPVMFWIHGGAFQSGSGNDNFYGPDYLIDKQVILVTCNYRLEVLGFLCLDIEEAPGNAGMKDQVAALNWVKKNIQNFGGDPDNITIFGESAGSASVCYHLHSPMSKGLFKRAICQSGTSDCYWSFEEEPIERAKALARELGEHIEDPMELYKFLIAQPVESLINRPSIYSYVETVRPIRSDVKWRIVSEKSFYNTDRFYYNGVEGNALDDGVEVMIGYNANEAAFFLNNETLDGTLKVYNNFLETFVPVSIANCLPLNKQLEVGRKVKNYYFGPNAVTRSNLSRLENHMSMDMFMFSTIQSAKRLARKCSNVYMYKFNIHSEKNIFGKLFNVESLLPGMNPVCHAEDLFYLFTNELTPIETDRSSKVFKLINLTTSIWTEFAKHGLKYSNYFGFRSFSSRNQEYFEITDKLTNKINPESNEIAFWENIYREYCPKELADK